MYVHFENFESMCIRQRVCESQYSKLGVCKPSNNAILSIGWNDSVYQNPILFFNIQR